MEREVEVNEWNCSSNQQNSGQFQFSFVTMHALKEYTHVHGINTRCPLFSWEMFCYFHIFFINLCFSDCRVHKMKLFSFAKKKLHIMMEGLVIIKSKSWEQTTEWASVEWMVGRTDIYPFKLDAWRDDPLQMLQYILKLYYYDFFISVMHDDDTFVVWWDEFMSQCK